MGLAGVELCSWRECWQTTQRHAVRRQGSEECVGHMEGRLFTLLGVLLRGTVFMKIPLGEQSSWQAPCPSLSTQHKHTATYTGWLICLHQVPHPCALAVLPISVKLVSVPVQQLPPPIRSAQTSAQNMSPNERFLQGLSSSGS